MRRVARFAFTFLLAAIPFCPRVSGGESLIYAVSIRVAGAIRSRPESTTVYSVIPGKSPVAVLSDANLPIALSFALRYPAAEPSLVMAVAPDHLFAPAIERSALRSTEPPSSAVYEFDLSKSGQYRKLFTMPPGESMQALFTDGLGSKIGVLSAYSPKGPVVYVFNSVTGAFLRKISLPQSTVFGSIQRVGWLDDDSTLFYTVEIGAGELPSPQNDRIDGVWLLPDDGEQPPVRLALALAAVHTPGYELDPSLTPVLTGETADHRFVFNTLATQTGHPGHLRDFAVVSSGAAKDSRAFLLNSDGPVFWPQPSKSGEFVAFTFETPPTTAPAARVESLMIESLVSSTRYTITSSLMGNAYSLTILGWIANGK